MNERDEAVKLAETVIKADEAGDCVSTLAGVRLARAVLALHAENERLRVQMVTMTEAFLGPDADAHRRNLLRAVKLHTTETDQLRAENGKLREAFLQCQASRDNLVLRFARYRDDRLPEAWRSLTNEQRLELITSACHGCGSLDTRCCCWDDS